MKKANAKGNNPGEKLLTTENKEFNTCPHCSSEFASEQALAIDKDDLQKVKEARAIERKLFWKGFGVGLLTVLKCIGYLIYVLTFMWLIFDIVEGLKKK